MRIAALALSIASLAPAAAAQQPPTSAADVTEEFRGLPALFDRVLAPDDPAGSEPRTLILLLDPTASLAATGFVDALSAALERNAALLGRVKIGVQRAGAEKPLLAPSDDARAILGALRTAFATTSDKIENVYAGLRDAALSLAARAGEHAVLLATLDNGDAEDDLEATIARLTGTKTRVFVFAGEAFLADTYWVNEVVPHEHPKETQLSGGDSAVIDVPFNWLFQLSSANEMSPSGFACYGLNRIAAGSGGKVFVYTPSNAGTHSCAIWGSCLFCTNDHAAPDETYFRARLAPFAPSVAARPEVLTVLGEDSAFKAVLVAWRAALQVGLLRGGAPKAGHATSVDSNAFGRGNLLLTGPIDRNAERAESSIKELDRIVTAFEADLKRVDASKSSARSRAIADYTRLMLQVTKTNLVTYAGWCREVAPRWFDKDPEVPAPPELPGIRGEARGVTIGWTNRSLCHGAKAFLEVELPGGERLKKELGQLDALLGPYTERYAHTPYLVALHRQGIATFHQTGAVTNVAQRPKSRNGPELGPSTGAPARPARTGGSTAGTGPATGGGGGG